MPENNAQPDRPMYPPSNREKQVEQALAHARSALHDLYGNRLHHLLLFGSQARGDAHAESDIDVLVVLDGPVDYATEVDRMLDVQTELFERFLILFSFIPVSIEKYADLTHPLIHNARAEGVLL
jgi:hypothetical protein